MAEARLRTAPMSKSRAYITELDHELITEHEDFPSTETETKEVADQLKQIRKKHDQTKESNLKKRQQLEKLRKDLEKFNAIATEAEEEKKMMDLRVNDLKKALETAHDRYEEEIRFKKTYLHMLDRMKQDKLSLECKANVLKQNLKSAKKVLNTESEKMRKSNEARFQSKLVLKELRESIAIDRRQKDERILRLQKNIRLRQEAVLRRDERQRRQAEIAEAAASLDKDSHEMKLRESLLLSRFWYYIITKKLSKIQRESVQVEQSFEKIRSVTGLTDIQDILERFLTKEHTYAQLLSAVAEFEHKLEKLKRENEIMRKELQEFQLEEGGSTRVIYSEIEKTEQQLALLNKSYAGLKEKHSKLAGIKDQIYEWAVKLFKRLGLNDENISSEHLHDMFETIAMKFYEIVQPLKSDQADSRARLTAYEHMKTDILWHEISTREFIERNQRIQTFRAETESEEDEDESIEEGSKSFVVESASQAAKRRKKKL